jgi:DNA adenine methylase
LRALHAEASSELDRAARFVYLNRNCFNGVYRTNQDGDFNVPRGKRVGVLPPQRQFVRCANALRRATLISGDFESAIEFANAGDFVYLDPPYAKEGSRRRGEYGCESFDTSDLARLARSLREIDKRKATFLLSYADCAEIQPIKTAWESRTVLVRRHVAGFQRHRATVREVLVSNRAF